MILTVEKDGMALIPPEGKQEMIINTDVVTQSRAANSGTFPWRKSANFPGGGLELATWNAPGTSRSAFLRTKNGQADLHAGHAGNVVTH